MTGWIHSSQSLGAVDGPGLCFVIFLQGCTLRCAHCHNPDTWSLTGSMEYTVDEVVQKVLRYRTYLTVSSGVTVLGGGLLLQWGFVAGLFHRPHREEIHTALDTAGVGDLEGVRTVLLRADLVSYDLKFSKDVGYLRYARGNMDMVLRSLQQTEELGVPLWIWHVVVPGLTDGEAYILEIVELAVRYPNLEWLESLPLRKYCISKHEAMRLEFPLRDFEERTDTRIQELYQSIETSFFGSIVPLTCK